MAEVNIDVASQTTLNEVKNLIQNLGGVSTTGTGVTVYSQTTAQTHTANSDYGWCSCLTKFIAPKDGLYTLTVNIKSLSSGDGFQIYKFKDRDIGVSTTKYSCLSETIYNSCTIGSKLYLGGYADSSLSTMDSSSDLYHYAVSLGTIAKSTSSGTFTFFAKAGEPIILVGHDTYNRTINSITVTCG